MANAEHLEILKRGVVAWNQWRLENPTLMPDLSRADLRQADLTARFLRGANLAGARLTGVNLSGANLSRSNLSKATLVEADLSKAVFTEAVLNQATLIAASLCQASFMAADLSGAVVVETDFTDPVMGFTLLGKVSLALAKGLDTVRRMGPSSVGIDTIYLSQGKIPEVFLRGAGVPESFIEYMRSLVGSAIEYYSCFISYSSKDEEFAQRLYADLQNKGVRCWFALHDVHGGRKLHEQIDQAIRVHEKVLLILSAYSMNSEWVKTEIAKARKREVEQRKQVLFPLRLASFETIRDWECFDADTGKDSAREIREYFIPDFSDWKKHDEYQRASFGFAQDKFWAVDEGFEGGGIEKQKLEIRRQKLESRS
jgi:hypothetical protein